MDREYEGIEKGIEEVGVGLMFTTAENLLEDKPVNIRDWRRVAQAYEIFIAPRSSMITQQLQAIGSLARAITASTPESASTYGMQISSAREGNLAVALYEAIEAKRLMEHQPVKAIDKASSYCKLGGRLRGLLPFVRKEKVISSALRIADIYHQSLELFIAENDLVEAMLPAAQLVGIVNSYSLTKYMEQALKWGERLALAVDGQFTGKSGMHRLVLSSNLISTCKRLAQQHPSNAREYYDKGLALTLNLKKGLDSFGLDGLKEIGENPETYFALYAHCMNNCVFFNTKLARVVPRQFEEYANKALEYLREYSDLAVKFDDPDLPLKIEQLRQTAYNDLHEVRTDWIPPDRNQARPAQLDLSDFIDHLKRHVEASHSQAVESARQIKLLPTPEAQYKGLTESLESWYQEIALRLSIVLSEIGLNHHTCRLLLALGAIASCRLHTSEYLISWLIHVEENNMQLSQYRNEVHTRQQILARNHMEDETKLIGRMVGLAVFVESLQLISSFQKTLPLMLRNHNVTLLTTILGKAQARRYDEEKLKAADDLDALLQSFPEVLRRLVLDAYNQPPLD